MQAVQVGVLIPVGMGGGVIRVQQHEGAPAGKHRRLVRKQAVPAIVPPPPPPPGAVLPLRTCLRGVMDEITFDDSCCTTAFSEVLGFVEQSDMELPFGRKMAILKSSSSPSLSATGCLRLGTSFVQQSIVSSVGWGGVGWGKQIRGSVLWPQNGAQKRGRFRPPERCPPTVGGHGFGGLFCEPNTAPVLGAALGRVLERVCVRGIVFIMLSMEQCCRSFQLQQLLSQSPIEVSIWCTRCPPNCVRPLCLSL